MKFWLVTASSSWSFISFMLTRSLAICSCLVLMTSSLAACSAVFTTGVSGAEWKRSGLLGASSSGSFSSEMISATWITRDCGFFSTLLNTSTSEDTNVNGLLLDVNRSLMSLQRFCLPTSSPRS